MLTKTQRFMCDHQALFVLSSGACEKQQYDRCYVGFSLFRERFPQLVEGYSNAGVALERLGRLEDAKTLYRVALKKIPNDDKAVGPLLNVLQVRSLASCATPVLCCAVHPSPNGCTLAYF